MTRYRFRKTTDGDRWAMFFAYTDNISPSLFTIDFPVDEAPVLVLRSSRKEDWPELVEEIKSLFPGVEPIVVNAQKLPLTDSHRAILEFLSAA